MRGSTRKTTRSSEHAVSTGSIMVNATELFCLCRAIGKCIDGIWVKHVKLRAIALVEAIVPNEEAVRYIPTCVVGNESRKLRQTPRDLFS
jgi:hypothetical protein